MIGLHQVQRMHICNFCHCHKCLKLKLQFRNTGGVDTQETHNLDEYSDTVVDIDTQPVRSNTV